MTQQTAAVADQWQEAIQRIVDAGKLIPAGVQPRLSALNASLDGLEDAVEEARSLGVAEEAIEDALGPWGAAATLEAPRPHLRLVR
ncbi:MAG: hypothetical protein QOJ80_1189 [Mycobacterium sp.]|jgi:hypothetical protein|nr:hypothetical protein [Mycobacterium sp.]